jgi:S-adenosylmethionine-diacylglycerol 3-amino-3-carboxypropyl transferase
VFDKRFIRWLTNQPASLFGLGIPPAQFDALAGDSRMAHVLRARLERLACGFPLNDNISPGRPSGAAMARGRMRRCRPGCSPHYAAARSSDRIEWRHTSFTDHLATQADASLDRYILLDAQDWMDDAQLTALWSEITRTARAGAARAVPHGSRGNPAARPRARCHPRSLGLRAEARELILADRSSIYGGLHLYRLKD